jgi:hypothetical protein
MTEIQQMLKYLEKIEKGQESIRAEMATKTDVATLNTKLDTMQEDITAIRASLDVSSSLSSDEENVLKARLTALENKVSILMRSHPL